MLIDDATGDGVCLPTTVDDGRAVATGGRVDVGTGVAGWVAVGEGVDVLVAVADGVFVTVGDGLPVGVCEGITVCVSSSNGPWLLVVAAAVCPDPALASTGVAKEWMQSKENAAKEIARTPAAHCKRVSRADLF